MQPLRNEKISDEKMYCPDCDKVHLHVSPPPKVLAENTTWEVAASSTWSRSVVILDGRELTNSIVPPKGSWMFRGRAEKVSISIRTTDVFVCDIYSGSKL